MWFRCGRADGDAQAALGALQDMLRQDMAPQPRTWRVVHDACRAAGRDDDADQLSEYAERLGVPVVPIYTFGENQLFTVHQPLRVRLPGTRTLGAKGVGGALPWPAAR